MMPRRYEQVLLTYFRQWPLWAYLAGWAALIVSLDLLSECTAWMTRPLQFTFIALTAMGPPSVLAHAKEQMAAARASLAPGFRTPHVLVPIMLTLAAIVALPLISHRALAAPVLGLVAAVSLASTGFAILAYFQSLRAIFVLCLATSFLGRGT